jgi:hypothetical protein
MFLLIVHLTFFGPDGEIPIRGSVYFENEADCLNARNYIRSLQQELIVAVEGSCVPARNPHMS